MRKQDILGLIAGDDRALGCLGGGACIYTIFPMASGVRADSKTMVVSLRIRLITEYSFRASSWRLI